MNTRHRQPLRYFALGRSLAAFFLIALCFCANAQVLGQDGGKRPIPQTLFSLNVLNLDYGVTHPTVPFKGWRSFRSVWSRVAPRPNYWELGRLDREIALITSRGNEPLLVLQAPPAWASSRPNERGCCADPDSPGTRAPPRSDTEWRQYVRTLALRYRGRVRAYELWNEANVSRFFTGTPHDLVLMAKSAYEEVKAVDPSAIVVSPSMTPDGLAFLERFLSAGGGQFVDVIGFHFYVAPRHPEAMLSIIAEVQHLIQRYVPGRPLWNTETGWRVANADRNEVAETWAGPAQPADIAAAYMARTYLLSWTAGIKRVYWYSWGHRSMGMTNHSGNAPNSVATAYEVLQRWVVGKVIPACTQTDQIWRCDVHSANERKASILWTVDGRRHFPIGLLGEGFNVVETLQGDTQHVENAIEVGPSPILVRPR